MPKLSLGYPPENTSLEMELADGIKIFYPRELKAQDSAAAIGIRLKSLLFWRWLEMDGAKAIAVYSN